MGNLKTMKKKELKKHVAAVHCSNGLSLLQRKISNVLLHHALPDLKSKENHVISIGHLCEEINYKGNNYEKIKDAMRHLIETRIEWDLFDESNGEELWAASSMLASVMIKRGQCHYAYSPLLRESLYNPSRYAKINLIIQARFASNYGLALYENCVRYQDIPYTKWFEMDVFRKVMGVQDGLYPIFRDFKRRVLDKAIDEVNRLSEIFIEPEFKKHGRTVVSIRFKITQREKKKGLALNMLTKQEGQGGTQEEEKNIIRKLVYEFGFDKNKAEIFMNDYGIEHIKKSIDYVVNTKAYKQGKVKGIATGYLIEAIRNNYQNEKKINELIDEKHKSAEEKQVEVKKTEERILKIKPKYIKYLQGLLGKVLEGINQNDKEDLTKEFKKFIRDSSLPMTLEYHLDNHGFLDPYVTEFFVPFLAKKKNFSSTFMTIEEYMDVLTGVEGVVLT